MKKNSNGSIPLDIEVCYSSVTHALSPETIMLCPRPSCFARGHKEFFLYLFSFISNCCEAQISIITGGYLWVPFSQTFWHLIKFLCLLKTSIELMNNTVHEYIWEESRALLKIFSQSWLNLPIAYVKEQFN